jgi:nucleotidyltransferase substrate binding protein (TIGR01987 family)
MTEKLDRSALRSAVASLDAALAVVGDREWFVHQSESVRRTLIAGVIQNFEFVYEISVKMIRRQLETDSASPTEIDRMDYRTLLRTAAEAGLIADVEAWFVYRQMRNITAHTYDQAKAEQVYQATLAFVEDARALLAELDRRNG